MAELAGFDVIGEVHIETILDLLDGTPIANPVDGKLVYIFGGPFSTDLKIDLGAPTGTIAIRFQAETELTPLAQQPLAKFAMTLRGRTSLPSSPALTEIAGEMSAVLSAGFALPPGAPPGSPLRPSFEFAAAAAELVIDPQSRSAIDSVLGPGGADRLTTSLRDALAAFLAQVGTKSLGVMPFTVVPGVDSHDPTQLSALPSIAWIDATTLGVFGYYRAAATGGLIGTKQSGDLGQAHAEYFYDQPGLFSVTAGRRVALLFSADAFRMVFACPAVRNQVVRPLVAKRELGRWVDWTRANYGEAIAQHLKPRLAQHLAEEMERDPGQDPQVYNDRANDDLKRDIEREIQGKATERESAWLDSPAGAGPEAVPGTKSVDAAVPPPCGNGSVEIARIELEQAQSDLVPMLRRLSVELAAGKIAGRYDVGGLVELISGDVSFSVDGELDLRVAVDSLGRVGADIEVSPPNISVSAGGLTGLIVDELGMTDEELWRAVMTILALSLQGEMTRAIEGLGFPRALEPSTPQEPFPTRLAEIAVEPDSLLVAGLVGRVPHWNESAPALLVEATLDSRTQADAEPIAGRLELDATDWGCEQVEFESTRTFWDETFSVKALLRDIPPPLTVLGWTIELGNFSWNTVGGARLLDPRPAWSNEPQTLAGGQLKLRGAVKRPDPVFLPYLRGPLTTSEVWVAASGDPESGWKIKLRGTDGNFYLRLSVDARDGDGKPWHAEGIVVHQGDQLQLPPEYYSYERECHDRFASWLRQRFGSLEHAVGTGRVLPGQPIADLETREAVAIRTAIDSGSPMALALLTAAGKRYGENFYGQLRRVLPLRSAVAGPPGKANS